MENRILDMRYASSFRITFQLPRTTAFRDNHGFIFGISGKQATIEATMWTSESLSIARRVGLNHADAASFKVMQGADHNVGTRIKSGTRILYSVALGSSKLTTGFAA